MFNFKVKLINLALAVLLSVFLGAGQSFAAPPDIQGHWAEKQISDWVDKGAATGYPDGSFKPDDGITRAEFITLVNKSFGLTRSAQISFTDVSTTDWFFEQVCRAGAAGYISGYGDGTLRPDNEISRQEVAAILSRLLKLKVTDNMGAISVFKDADSIPQWSKGTVNAVVAGGYMSGYPDQTYQPERAITRAEAIVTLDRAVGGAAKTITFNQAGIFGPESGVSTIDGNVVVGSAGVTLQNTAINESLILAEGVGDGDVYLKNVTVKGTTTIKGGGARGINLENCTLGTVIVNKEDGSVRIAASGGASVLEIKLESGASLEEANLTGEGFGNITVSGLPADSAIRLTGNFNALSVSSPNVAIELVSGSVDSLDLTENAAGTVVKVTAGNVRELNIGAKAAVNVESGTVTNLNVAENAAGTMLNLAAQAKVTTLTLAAAAKVTGQGAIETALVKANGSTIEQSPEKIVLSDGVTIVIANKVVTQSTPLKTGGAGGGSSGNDTDAPKISAVTFTVDNKPLRVEGYNNNFDINLADFDNTSMFTDLSINASSNAEKAEVTFLGIKKEVNFVNGYADLSVKEILGSLDTGEPGISLKTLKSLISSSSEIPITVYGSNGTRTTATVKIIL